MKLRHLALSLCALAIASLPVFAQEAGPEIPGTYNPRTGTFQPRVVAEAPLPAVTTTTHGGTLIVNFAITLKTAVPTGDKVICDVVAFVTDPLTLSTIDESASTVATVSGSTATCAVKIPYSWSLAAATDMVSWNYAAAITPTSATVASALLLARSSSHTGASFTLPANGVTTTKAVAVTL
jgi:hypothetical protein